MKLNMQIINKINALNKFGDFNHKEALWNEYLLKIYEEIKTFKLDFDLVKIIKNDEKFLNTLLKKNYKNNLLTLITEIENSLYRTNDDWVVMERRNIFHSYQTFSLAFTEYVDLDFIKNQLSKKQIKKLHKIDQKYSFVYEFYLNELTERSKVSAKTEDKDENTNEIDDYEETETIETPIIDDEYDEDIE